ncbi:MAG: site-specific integrase [Bdellovibrionales bacterium]|nr:site-specific integrase [Bdellovibrionales bacterium]
MSRIYDQLQTVTPLVGDLFWVLLHTGLRLNEALGLHLGSLQSGQPTERNLHQMLKRNGINCHGYIVLEDQPKTRDIRRKDGHVERVPLKGRKKITPKNNRVIPVEDARTFNTLVRLFRSQKELFKERRYGPNIKDYLLFNGLTQAIVTSHLRKGFEALKLRFKSAHCYRHTFSTHLCGRYNDMFYVKTVLGHGDIKITERYVHLYEAMQRGLVTNQYLSSYDDFQLIDEA